MSDNASNGVWLKVRLPYDLNVKLRSAAMVNRETLAGFVVRLLSGCMCGPEKFTPVVVQSDIKPATIAGRPREAVEAKPLMSVTGQQSEPKKLSPPVGLGGIPIQSVIGDCAGCGNPFNHQKGWKDSRGFYYCAACSGKV